MKKSFLCILLLVIGCNFSFAAVSKFSRVEGRIVAIDKDNVTLMSRGRKVKVPRKSIPKNFKIRPGNDVYAEIPSSEKIKNRKTKK